MPPGRCGTGVPLDQLHPGDAAEVRRFLAYLADVAGRVRGGATRAEAQRAAYPEHYPEPAAEAEDDAVEDLHPWETGGDPLGEDERR